MNDIRLCFVGDSFVNGTGDPQCLGWAGRLCADLGQVSGTSITYYNLGVRRDTSRDIVMRWETEVMRRFVSHADCRVVFSFGTNDTTLEEGSLRVDPEESLRNAQVILKQAQQRVPVLMVGPPPIADAEQNQRTARLSQQLEQLCQTLAIPYLNVFPSLLNSAIWMTEVAQLDGAHPQAAGYSLLAELVQQWSAWQNWVLEIQN